jgi:hypothetical protein
MISAYHGDISAYLWREKMFLGGSFANLVTKNSKSWQFNQISLAGDTLDMGASDASASPAPQCS